MSVAGAGSAEDIHGPGSVALPARIRRFREQYRELRIPDYYSGVFHLGFTSVASVAVVVFSILQLHSVTALEWLTIPATFLYANLAEYLGHRGPMHHPAGFLRLIYERHTLQHHRFFTDEAMQFDSSRDFHAVVSVMLLAVLAGLGQRGVPVRGNGNRIFPELRIAAFCVSHRARFMGLPFARDAGVAPVAYAPPRSGIDAALQFQYFLSDLRRAVRYLVSAQQRRCRRER